MTPKSVTWGLVAHRITNGADTRPQGYDDGYDLERQP
jgi:hypothetical protein